MDTDQLTDKQIAFCNAADKACSETKYGISPGIAPCCSQCQSEYDKTSGELAHDLEHGNLADEPSFSHHSCECCGNGLGGNRYVAHALVQVKSNDNPRKLQWLTEHYEICEDCVLYIANGDVPDEESL